MANCWRVNVGILCVIRNSLKEFRKASAAVWEVVCWHKVRFEVFIRWCEQDMNRWERKMRSLEHICSGEYLFCSHWLISHLNHWEWKKRSSRTILILVAVAWNKKFSLEISAFYAQWFISFPRVALCKTLQPVSNSFFHVSNSKGIFNYVGTKRSENTHLLTLQIY